MHIDTLSIARELKATELPVAQAEAIAAAIGRSVTDSVPSKGDLEQVRTGLDAKVEQVRSSLESKIEQVRSGLELQLEQVRTDIERSRNQLLVGFVSTQIAFAGLIVAAVKLL